MITRATENTHIFGKNYRKGQFIPNIEKYKFKYKPRNQKNIYNCIFCNEDTGECLFNVNWTCRAYCQNKVSFNPQTQIKTKEMFDKMMTYLIEKSLNTD